MNKKQQLIESAYQLFYRQGFHACGVELLAQNAGTTKRTLYSHFPSKDDLIAAVLDYRHQQFVEQMQGILAEYAEADTAAAYLDFLNRWINSDDFHGCLFVNACAEYAEPQNPLHLQAAAHKRQVRDILYGRLAAAGFIRSADMADLLFVGGEGLIVTAQTVGKEKMETHGRLLHSAVEAMKMPV